jgi:hypothetical protein
MDFGHAVGSPQVIHSLWTGLSRPDGSDASFP